MPTQFFLRDGAAANPPTAGEKSTALPVGTFSGNSGAGFEDLRLLTAKGTTQVSKDLISLAQTGHQDNYLARFTSLALAAQTIAANTWTLAIAVNEGNAAANSFFVGSIYVWRPSNNTVVGFVYDSDTTVGVEWGVTEDGQVLSLTGSAVTILLNDVLVFEMWRHAVQGMAAAYTQTIYFDGTTDVTDTTTTDAASYLQTPQVLTFGSTTFTQALVATEVAVLVLTRVTTFLRTLASTLVSSVVLTRVTIFVRSLASTLVSSPVLTKVNVFVRSLPAVSSSVAGLSRVVTIARSLLTTAGSTGAITRVATFATTFSVAAVSSPMITRIVSFFRTLAGTTTTVPAVTAIRTAFRTLTAVVGSAPNLTSVLIILKTLAATTSTAPSITRVTTFLRTLAAQVASVSTAQAFIILLAGRPLLFTASSFGAGVNFYFEVFMKATSGTATAELVDLTNNTIVAGSPLSTTNTTDFVRLRSGTLTLVDGHEYRCRLRRGGTSGGVALSGLLVVV